ncbi:hypothetical protein [Nitrosopumilus sp.]|uniref:hypothetical protein n=1 Tax=Nitrosopumilus sp. TaxID=2024843 RepID=UPI00260AC451|nr:hypothetical protein [Nitrosopumilus sp.]
MKIGNFPDSERRIRLEIEIHCTKCGKQVPGGIQTGEKYAQSAEFQHDLKELKENYLCGICRDKKRVQK